MYNYCPNYALAWHYRKLNLLNELVRYKADIMCLQEVQSDHFSDFLSPELQKHGYSAIYKKKTAEMYTGNSYAMDGCATFYKRDKFTLVKKYEVSGTGQGRAGQHSFFLSGQGT
jgi:CCR4-NOT transcription complex subunit 6